jgi:hypothetical protein
MSIPQPTASTDRILHYADFHVAMLEAAPQAAHLVAGIQEEASALEAARVATRNATKNVARASALLSVADDALDEACRQCHLSVLGAVSKNESNPQYQAAFPKGLSALLAGRGKRQEIQVKALLNALANHLPAVSAVHSTPLAAALAGSEEKSRAYEVAQRTEGDAGTSEVIARNRLVDQLHRNRGALRVLFPRDARRVRGFFPASRGAAEVEAGDAPGNETDVAVGGEAGGAAT